jgi:hypothetical protein
VETDVIKRFVRRNQEILIFWCTLWYESRRSVREVDMPLTDEHQKGGEHDMILVLLDKKVIFETCVSWGCCGLSQSPCRKGCKVVLYFPKYLAINIAPLLSTTSYLLFRTL